MSERYQRQRHNGAGLSMECWDVVDTHAQPQRILAYNVLGDDANLICAALNKNFAMGRRKELEAAPA